MKMRMKGVVLYDADSGKTMNRIDFYLECELEWEHDLLQNGYSAVMCFKVVNVWMDESLFDEELHGRYGDNGYLYNIHSPQNPETGKEYETCVGVMQKFATYDELK